MATAELPDQAWYDGEDRPTIAMDDYDVDQGPRSRRRPRMRTVPLDRDPMAGWRPAVQLPPLTRLHGDRRREALDRLPSALQDLYADELQPEPDAAAVVVHQPPSVQKQPHRWSQAEIDAALRAMNLPDRAPLTRWPSEQRQPDVVDLRPMLEFGRPTPRPDCCANHSELCRADSGQGWFCCLECVHGT